MNIQDATAWTNKTHRLYINGRWLSGADTFECRNPANGAVLGCIANADRGAVDEAVSAARAAFGSTWRCSSRRDRAARLSRLATLIHHHREELAALISLENGKTYQESLHDDMPDTADVFSYYAGWTDKLYGDVSPVDAGFVNYVTREPVGVCGLIVPWNFPLLLAMWKIAPALAMGNTVVIKPSEETPLSLLRFFELVHAAEVLPPGVINLVTGDGATGALIAEHPRIDKVSFTGSTHTGKRIVQAAGVSNLKTLTLELGGKAPVLIFDDLPDFDAAVSRCFQVAFSHKGEKCTEPTRLIIQETIYERFAAALAERARGIRCGDPFDPATQQGPQCSRAQFEKIMRYIEEGRSGGCALLAGGASGGDARGFFVAPTIFGDVDNQLALAREEIFGPVLVLQRFRTEEQALALANDTIYGLAAGVYTANLSRAHRLADALDAGQVFINRYGCYDFASPFGGFKQSGWGKEMGRQSLDAYTRSKSVWVAL